MFSFLTTAYRTEDVVGRAVASVQAQTLGDWEMVVVDNGPSEAMVAAVTPYLDDPRVRLVRQDNAGPSGGIATAAEHARGRYLVVLNSDDHVAPGFARRTAEVLAGEPGVAAVTCDAELFSDSGEDVGPGYLAGTGIAGVPDPGRPLRLADVIDGPCPYYTAPVRRDVWDEVGGMVSLRDDTTLVDDLDFWLRVVGAGHDVRMLPDRLGRFRIEPGSVSRPTDPARAEEREAQLEAALQRAAARSGTPEDHAALERALARVHHWQAVRRARLALREGDVAEAARQWAVALEHRRTPRLVLLRGAARVAPPLLRAVYAARARRGGGAPA